MDPPAYFVPGRDPSLFYPLRSYLRQPPANVVETYIQALTEPGDLVVDPFGCTPTVARVALRMGRRAIAVESNPLWSWLARAMAALPPPAEIDAALARLGDALKDEAPLRTHIDQLYATICAGCHQPTPADYFICERAGVPIRRHYTCARCAQTREDPATEDDLKRAAAFDAHGFHYHYALERVLPEQDLYAERLRRMLDTYTPRNLYALVTLTVKIDTLFRATPDRDILLLLLLHLLDRGTSFYATPLPRARAQLALHKQFVEFNLWREMEAAARELSRQAQEPPLELANTGADVLQSERPTALVGRGSAKGLARALPEHTVALALAGLPTRRLAVWALSYFWGAWILGRAAVDSLIPSLDPHKADPTWERRWYFDSLCGSLDAIARLLRLDTRAVFSFDESWDEVIESLLLAAAGAPLELESLLFQPRLGDYPRHEFESIWGEYRIVFSRRAPTPMKGLADSELAARIRAAALDAGRDILSRRAEPLAFSWIHHAAYAQAARKGYLNLVMSTNLKTPPVRFVSLAVREGLAEGYAQDLDHYQGPDQLVWLRRQTEGNGFTRSAAANAVRQEQPLIDRIDDAVHAELRRAQATGCAELEDSIYRLFPGDLTPEGGLIDLCAEAYADRRTPSEPPGARDEGCAWLWRRTDSAQDKANALEILARLGERLEYRVGEARPFDLTWEQDGEIVHGFVWRERARLDDLAQIHIAPTRGYLIVPETQVALLRAKIRQLPLLAEAFNEAGWDYVRVPFAEELLQQEKLERHDAVLIAGLVPPVAGDRTQLELF